MGYNLTLSVAQGNGLNCPRDKEDCMKRFSILVAVVLAVVCFANLAQAGLFHKHCGACEAVKACAPAACAAPAPAPAACCTSACECKCGIHPLKALKERCCRKECACATACTACAAPKACAPVAAPPVVVAPPPKACAPVACGCEKTCEKTACHRHLFRRCHKC
jgi:hypothetical protein